MKSEWTLMRIVPSRALKVHLVALEAGIYIEAIAFIGPPSIDADLCEGGVLRPIRRSVARGFGRSAGVRDLAMEVAGRHDVENDLHMLIVYLLNVAGGIGEDSLVECE